MILQLVNFLNSKSNFVYAVSIHLLLSRSVFFQNTFILQSLDGFRVLRVACFYDAEGDTFFSVIGFSVKFPHICNLQLEIFCNHRVLEIVLHSKDLMLKDFRKNGSGNIRSTSAVKYASGIGLHHCPG